MIQLWATGDARRWGRSLLPANRAAGILVVFAGLMGLARLANGNDLLTLYRAAVTHDAAVQAAQYRRDAAVEVRPQARAEWLPHVDATASRERMHLTESIDLIPGIATTPAAPVLPQGCALTSDLSAATCLANANSYGGRISQTLFSYESLNRWRRASLEAASAEASLSDAQQKLIVRVARAYFAVLAARHHLEIARDERNAFGVLLNQTKGREQTGLGSRSEVQQVQAFYDSTGQGVIDAQNGLDDASLSLAEIAGVLPDELSPLSEDALLPEVNPLAEDQWVGWAQENNAQVRAAALLTRAAERDIEVQRGRALPSLVLAGTGVHTSADSALGGDNTLETVGVYLTWALYQGGAVASGLRQSHALSRQRRAELDLAERETERLTRVAHRNAMRGLQRVAAARSAVQSGRDAVEAVRRDIEFNVGSPFVLLNYQQIYFAALNSYDEARYDYLTNLLTLWQLAGRLDEHDVTALDALLVSRHP
jgi:outer membrane protein